MNKKIFKSLFMGALLVGSVGTLTSCSKDYDNDINSLKDQIAKMATTEALNAKVTELQTSIATAQSTAAAAQTTATTALNNAATNATALATLKSAVADLGNLVATKADQTALNAAITNMNSLLANKVDKSVYDAKIADLESYIKTNSANIDKNTAALEAYKKVVDEKINAIVADIEAKYATQDALKEAVANLETQLGALPTKDYVAEQIAAAVKNLANKDDVTAEIAAAVKGLASEEYVTNAIKDLASKSDVATAKEEVLKAMSENNDVLKAYIAAAIASQADIDAANLAAKVTEINDLIKSNKDESDAALAAAKIELSQQINSVKSTLETQFNTNLAEAVSNLTTLINGKASTEELAAAKTALQDEIDAATGRIGDLETAVGDLKTRVGALETNLNNKVEIADFNAAIAGLTGSYTGLKSQIDALMKSIESMVTSVDLVNDYNNRLDNRLYFESYTEKATTFGPNGEVKFTEGTVKSTEDALLIRVSPTSATLSRDSISILNSQNLDLTKDFIDVVSCEPYTELLTRAATTTSSTGLWLVKFKLKETVNATEFQKAINYNGVKVRFCVAVKSKLTGTDRAVVSEYQVNVYGRPATSNGKLDFAVNNTEETKNVSEIHNRYLACEDGTDVSGIDEATWTDNAKPEIAENVKTSTNITHKTKAEPFNDNREGLAPISAYIGQDITISFEEPVRAFYVTLDKAFAKESGVSEINAWDHYDYSGLNTVFGSEGGIQKGVIRINSTNTKSDIIGFRVYAVNLDGTLQDPDGKAFYVSVSDPSTTSKYSTSLTSFNIDNAGNVLNGQSPKLDSGDLSDLANATRVVVTPDENNPEIKYVNTPLYTVTFIDKNGKSMKVSGSDNLENIEEAGFDVANIVSVQATMSDLSAYIDNASYIQYYSFQNNIGTVVRNITVTVKKTLPTAAPANSTYSAKGGQMEEGTWRAFLTADGKAAGALNGNIALNNAFNGLFTNDETNTLKDPNFKFIFADADKDADGNLIPLVVTSEYGLTVNKAFIDNETPHATVVNYAYKGISTTLNADGTGKVGDVNIKVDSFETIFCCYMYSGTVKPVQSWSWTSTGAAAAAKLVYALDGQKIGSKEISGKNEISSAYSTTLDKLIGTALIINTTMTNPITLTTKSNGVVDEYFSVKLKDDNLEFTVTKSGDESKPKVNVPSTLTINCLDWYGHEVVITRDATVIPNAPAKS